jgi:hypothetical protein
LFTILFTIFMRLLPHAKKKFCSLFGNVICVFLITRRKPESRSQSKSVTEPALFPQSIREIIYDAAFSWFFSGVRKRNETERNETEKTENFQKRNETERIFFYKIKKRNETKRKATGNETKRNVTILFRNEKNET